jgi:hypothetical protein
MSQPEGSDMILYHYTSFYNLRNVGPENIVAFGLKAMPADWPELLGLKGVWLTTDPDMPGILTTCHEREVRIRLVIPSSDKRLIHVPKLLRKLLCPEERASLEAGLNEVSTAWREWYFYQGDIPCGAGYIRAIEYADEATREETRQSPDLLVEGVT